MFFDDRIEVIDNPSKATEQTMKADLQEFETTITVDDYNLDISKRLFCKADSPITLKSYIKYRNDLYKVIKIKNYDDDFLEIYLYKCEGRD